MANPSQGRSNEDIRKDIQSAITREMSALMAHHKCATCHTMYVPLLQLGQRKCQLHPEPVNFSGSLSSYQMYQPRRDLVGATPLHTTYANAINHHSCCGAINASAATSYTGSRPIDKNGCTRGDHMGHLRWKEITPGMMRDENENGVFVRFNPTELTLTPETAMHHALSERFYVYPMLFVRYLAETYNEEIKMRAELHHITPVDVYNDAEILARFFGMEYHYGIDENELFNHCCVNFSMGTKKLIVEVRDAYICMCKKFNLPTLIISNRDAVQQHRQQHQMVDGAKDNDGGFNMEQALYDMSPEALDSIHVLNASRDAGPQAATNDELMQIIIKAETHDADDVMDIDMHHRFFDFVIAPWMSPTNLAEVVGAHIAISNSIVGPSVHPMDRNVFHAYSDKY